MLEELDYCNTRLGELVLRRRLEPKLGVEVYEVKLGDGFLMSSLFTAGETALADLAIPRMGSGPLDVAVGGLGLGYTAQAVLRHGAVRSLVVIEALEAVIGWHKRSLVPVRIAGEPRCDLLHGDFFALAASPALDPRTPGRRFNGILVDIDHSPRERLDESSAGFYTREGMRGLVRHLLPGGVFGLWSNDPPDEGLAREMGAVFAWHETHVVAFDNPLQGNTASSTIYLAGV